MEENIKNLFKQCKDNIDTKEGYEAYYQLSKLLEDNKLDLKPINDLWILFNNYDELCNYFEKRAEEENRLDLLQ